MVNAWYINNDSNDQREEHHLHPPKLVSALELLNLTGVEYFKLNVNTYSTDGVLENIKKERGYRYVDEVTCFKECLPNYEEKLKMFYTEHKHAYEEIRLCEEGSGYFDVRDKNDDWIRIEVKPGDMLILPGGIYHRFTLDRYNYIKVKRFYTDEPIWSAQYRSVAADHLENRKQ